MTSEKPRAEDTLPFWQQAEPTTSAFCDVVFHDFCEYSGECDHRAKLSTSRGYFVGSVRWTPKYPEDGVFTDLFPIEGWDAWALAARFGDIL